MVGAGVDFGTGYIPTTTEYGTGFFIIREHGGQGLHQLTIAEMPSHNHSQGYWWGFNGGGGSTAPHQSNVGPQASSTYTGGNQPHNNMPPYYALAYIMKT